MIQPDQHGSIAPEDTAAPLVGLHSGVARWAASDPQRAAVVCGTTRLTYGELARASGWVAAEVRRRGIAPGSLVALLAEPGCEQVIALLGILRAGAAYVPLDPTLTPVQRDVLLRTANPRLLMTTSGSIDGLRLPVPIETVCVNDPRWLTEECPEAPGWDPVLPETLAYVLFKFDGQGAARGVMIEHHAALNTLEDVNRRFAVSPADRILGCAPLGLDLSVYDICGTFTAGATLIMGSSAGDPQRLLRLMHEEAVTVCNTVPPLMQSIVECAISCGEKLPESLRLVLLSRERIPLSLPALIRSVAERARVVNLGGTAETSLWSSVFPIDEVKPDWKRIPYGRPLTGQRVSVLNERLAPCPAWVPGTLYIGGAGLFRGYWDDEVRTLQSVVTDPKSGERLFATQDTARLLPDGTIDLLGRQDQQLKLDGYRVELSEIEAALLEHPGVREAVATVVQAEGGAGLAAYVVLRDAQTTTDQVLQFLKTRVPSYMLPERLVPLDRLPRSADHRLDRHALAKLAAPAVPVASPAPPPPPQGGSDSNVTRLLGVAAQALHVQVTDADANLLDLGASSIDIIRFINQIENEFGVRLAVEAVFRRPSITEVARMLHQSATDVPLGSVPAPEEQPAPEERPGEPAGQNIPAVLTDPLEREQFKKARHALRRASPDQKQLELPVNEAALPGEFRRELRRTHRQFAARSLPLASFSGLLGLLREASSSQEPRYLYPSAGGLYPVQTYLYVKPGRIEGIEAGTYYYHPVEHRLVLLSSAARLERGAFDWINQPVFDQSAFALFFVMQRRAIAPMYGNLARDFSLYEAGAMGQLLRMLAPGLRLGLCSIGSVRMDTRMRQDLQLDEGHELLHSMLGGPITEAVELDVGIPRAAAGQIAEMLEKLERLSKEDVQLMLEEKRHLRRGPTGT